ncbi:heterokaryon incompatibility protein-domain-containing protein [Rhypophila decipiens]|uniref:Heterokaryon incompatibility protein-domain-containing protein n=1 Tax=Rhypophila decipiens TaxID=261697 RepID=A0AAN6Y8B7_9PEZI|nr:heterokaryon incompatibility protein-domain-containing protein [Rhypophila decipiens]
MRCSYTRLHAEIKIPITPGSQLIRVLDVHAPLKSHNEPVQGELRTIDLTLNAVFSTLSYVWGDSGGERQFVHCGSHQIPLLPNGYSSLKTLRKKLGRFTIWIDAICINQDDDDEKQRQIPLMGEIYSKAESGYIWLGAGDARVRRALKYLSRPPFERFYKANRHMEDEEGRLRWPRMYYSAAFAFICQRFKLHSTRSPARRHFWTLPFSTTMDDIEVMLQNEWVERVWTYQELLLSRKPILVYGGYHLEWDTFAISVGSLDYTTSVDIWFNLALARDQVHNPATVWTQIPEPSPIRRRSKFMDDVKRTARQIEKLGIVTFLIPMIALASLPIIPLVICGFVAVGMYASGNARDRSSFNYKFCWGVVWTLAAWLVFFIFAGLMWWGCFRLSLRALIKPSGLDKLRVESLTSVNIIDLALKRKSKYVHDKAFGMQSILQKLAKVPLEFSTPDYKQELIHVFRELNIQILTAIGHQQLLYIAALAPMTGQPCWMPDWTAEIDSTWLSPDIHLNDRETLDHSLQITQRKTELVGDSFQVFSWEIRNPEWSTISFEDCTDTNETAGQTAVHMRNIQAALRIFGLLQASKRDCRTYVNEPETLKELQHLISVVTEQSPKEVKKWLTFLQKQQLSSGKTLIAPRLAESILQHSPGLNSLGAL